MNLFKSFLHVITRYFSFVKQSALSFSKVFTFTSKGISLTNVNKQPPEALYKKDFLKKFAKFIGKQLCLVFFVNFV